MKKITTLLVLLLTLPFYGQWVQQNSGVTETLNDVYCITEDFVVVVGDAGTILKTTDGGLNWIQKTSGTSQNLLKVQFPTPNVGYAVGINGIILKTVNGGEDWSSIGIGEILYFHDGFSCVNENIFYIENGNGTLKRTIDGGATFEIINATGNQDVENLQFLNEQVGYASNYQNLYKTTDGGNTWLLISAIYENVNNTPFHFFNESVGFIIKPDHGLYRTTDGGQSFVFLYNVSFTTLKLFAPSENLVWGATVEVALNGNPNYTLKGEVTDLGFQATEGNPTLRSIYFANVTKGYGVGWGGQIYKNSTGYMTDLGTNQIGKKESIKIYPNPASKQITISLDENPNQAFSIQIMDCVGKKVFAASYEFQNHVIINTENLSKGIYYVTVFTQDKKQTQKLIIN